MVRSDTDVLRTTQGMGRSMSAPSGVDDDSLAEVVRLQRFVCCSVSAPSSVDDDSLAEVVHLLRFVCPEDCPHV